MFLACQTQWNREFAGMDGTLIWKGLDYPAVKVVMQMQGHGGKKATAIFRDVQTLEQSALPILNQPKKR